jgi:hypothetical protein
MMEIARRQRVWTARELRLMDYRRTHLAETQAAWANELRELTEQDEQQAKLDGERIAKMRDGLRGASAEVLEVQGPVVAMLEKSAGQEHGEREKAIQMRQQVQQLYLAAMNADKTHKEYYLREMKAKDDLLMLSTGRMSSEDYLKRLTRNCPKCGVVTVKEDGCNVVCCQKCQFTYCWNCGKEWAKHVQNHWGCSEELATKKLSAQDDGTPITDEEMRLDDPTYYPPPMTIALKQECVRLQYYQNRYHMHKAYKVLDQKNRERNREEIFRTLCCETVPETANGLVSELLGVFDYARNTLMWSYAAAYFIARGEVKRTLLEMSQGNLEMRVESVGGIIFHYTREPYAKIQEAVAKLDQCTRYLLEVVST